MLRSFKALLSLLVVVPFLGGTGAAYVPPIPEINTPPTDTFDATCAAVVCTFNATASSDPNGQITRYEWTFGDGDVAEGVIRVHRYDAPGDYLVRLRVVDDDGGDDEHEATVSPEPNQAPTASFQVTCNGLSCRFDPSTSTDADGTIARTLWDFGDGNSSSEVAPAHSFPGAGSYQVALRVWDNLDAYHTVRRAVTVAGAAGEAPAAPPKAPWAPVATDAAMGDPSAAEADTDPAYPTGQAAKAMPSWVWWAMIGAAATCTLGVLVVHRLQARK